MEEFFPGCSGLTSKWTGSWQVWGCGLVCSRTFSVFFMARPGSSIKRQFKSPFHLPSPLCLNLEALRKDRCYAIHLFVHLWGLRTESPLPTQGGPALVSPHCWALMSRPVNCLQRLRAGASIGCAVKITASDIYKALSLLFLHLILTTTWGGNTILALHLYRWVNLFSELPENKRPVDAGFCFQSACSFCSSAQQEL